MLFPISQFEERRMTNEAGDIDRLSRIKGARCAAVGRVTVQRLIATFLAWPHLAGISLLLCAQQVNAMCPAFFPTLSLTARSAPAGALPDQPTPVKARALRARLRRLAALTGIACPDV